MTKKRDFDEDARSWDASAMRSSLAKDVAGAIIKEVTLDQRSDVLDFGCGTGLLTFHVQPLVRSVTGVDSSNGMLEVFRTKVREQRVGNVRADLLDLTAGDILTGKYHVIMSSMTLHHVKDIRALLVLFYKHLWPGGRIALADLDEEGGFFHDNNDGVFHFGFDREKMGRLFKEAGFTDVSDAKAAQIHKPDRGGIDRVFSVFLMTGRRQ